MEVIYTIASKLGTGIGYTAERTIEQIRKAGCLKQTITGDDLLVQSNDSILKDNAFDVMASLKIQRHCDILHSWGHGCYAQLLKAHKIGAKTIVERASSHILTQNKILTAEFKQFGFNSVPIHPWIIKKSLAEFKETDYVTVPSRFAYDSFLDEKYPEDKLLLNPFGVDVEKFHPMTVERPETFRVLFAGENWIRKGLVYLLKAWNELDLKDASLYVRSNAPIMNDIDYKSIIMTGWVPDLVEFYNTFDVFCLPTLEEGNALVVGEAAACGVPSITTRNSGTWLDEESGRESCDFVPPRDIIALKAALRYWYENRDDLKTMGKEARKKAEQNTWDHYGKRLIENYEKIVG